MERLESQNYVDDIVSDMEMFLMHLRVMKSYPSDSRHDDRMGTAYMLNHWAQYIIKSTELLAQQTLQEFNSEIVREVPVSADLSK